MDYIRDLNQRRFGRHPNADQVFLSPNDLVALLAKAVAHRGSLDGDDRALMIAEGTNPSAFELPDTYQYLKVPAEGRVGILPLEEMAHWVPVTLHGDVEPNTRIGFRRSATRNPQQHLVFGIDPEFQRMVNYATIILAPNWFQNPSTDKAVLDAFLGPPVPARLQGVPADDPIAVQHSWKDGTELPVHRLRALFPDRPIWLSCRSRNLPGT